VLARGRVPEQVRALARGRVPGQVPAPVPGQVRVQARVPVLELDQAALSLQQSSPPQCRRIPKVQIGHSP
jgi:hypothetical protein